MVNLFFKKMSLIRSNFMYLFATDKNKYEKKIKVNTNFEHILKALLNTKIEKKKKEIKTDF